ncbi:Gfo/Idh/MocA family protein [Actinomadura sp. 6N118]|uniref:Gfo/Idh/MocA family protein n=1 Tax=Actinomadura sp. 6N118 TaxID=3375151 RepID=UPI00378E77E8
MRIRIAVAGLGVIAQTVHLPLLERLRDHFEITAVCDLSAALTARVAARYGVPACHTDLETMLVKGGFDALVLLTSGSHGTAAAMALRHGYPVLCEKPLAYTRAEAAELAALDTGPSPKLMVGYMKQYDPAVMRLTRAMPEAHAIQVTVLHPSDASQLAFANLPAPPDDVPAGALSALRAADDGLLRTAIGDAPPAARGLYTAILNSISHDLSLLRLLACGAADVDHAAVWSGRTPGDRSIELTGPLRDGGRYAIHWHLLTGYPAYRETVAIQHATGSAELVFPTPYLLGAATRLTLVESDGGAERRTRYADVTPSFQNELLAFHAMVTEGVPPLTGVVGGAEDIVIAQLAVRRLRGITTAGEAAEL